MSNLGAQETYVCDSISFQLEAAFSKRRAQSSGSLGARTRVLG